MSPLDNPTGRSRVYWAEALAGNSGDPPLGILSFRLACGCATAPICMATKMGSRGVLARKGDIPRAVEFHEINRSWAMVPISRNCFASVRCVMPWRSVAGD